MIEGESLQTTILRNILHNNEYTRKVIPFLKPDYFEGPSRLAFDMMVKFVAKYNALPTAESLHIMLENSEYTEQQQAAVSNIVEEISHKQDINQDWLVEMTEKWCQDRSIYLAIMESIEIIDGKHKDLTKNALPELLQNALSVSFDSNIGHDYLDGALERFEFYNRVDAKIRFDIELFNTVTNGGITPKTLNVVMAQPGGGKSLVLCHFAASNLLEGKNVLYITMEMAEEKIAQRIDANLMNMPLQDIEKLDKNSFTSRITKITNKTNGKLIIKEYPTGGAHVGHFRALLNELRIKKNMVPDVIYIDYINICASSRIKGGVAAAGTYSLVKSIAEEIRGLGVEFNVPIWSATQVNRGGVGNSDFDMSNTSDSMGLPHTVDSLFGLITNDELEKLNQIMIKQIKNRYGDINTNKCFVVGIDRAKMKLYDVEDSAQTLVNTAVGKAATDAGAKDFSSFKY